MSDDIDIRLRNEASSSYVRGTDAGSLLIQAAAEIDRLRFEYERADEAARRLGTKWKECSAQIKRMKAERTALDAVVVYYMSRGWPSYSDRERADKTWTHEKTATQQAALERHMARTGVMTTAQRGGE